MRIARIGFDNAGFGFGFVDFAVRLQIPEGSDRSISAPHPTVTRADVLSTPASSLRLRCDEHDPFKMVTSRPKPSGGIFARSGLFRAARCARTSPADVSHIAWIPAVHLVADPAS
jgi:hypothetical protein